MKVVFLGTGSCYPTQCRAVSCTAVQLDTGEVWIFDCGEGSQVQIQRSSVKPGKISKIFITHLHGDHVFGLPGLLCSIGTGLDQEKGRNTVVEIYGPLGLRKFLHTTLGLSGSNLMIRISVTELVPREDMYPPSSGEEHVEHELPEREKLPVEVSHRKVEMSNNGSWNIFKSSDFSVSAAALKHRIPSFGFVITESSSPGSLDTTKLLARGVKPGPVFGKIKRGETVELESGEVLQPQEFLGPDIPGRKIAILGDTCDSSEIVPIGQNLDLLVHEATNENILQESCIVNGHSTPDMAAKVAMDCNAKNLVLFHVSQRYKPFIESVDLIRRIDTEDVRVLGREAREFLSNAGRSDINVVVAQDFYEFVVQRPK